MLYKNHEKVSLAQEDLYKKHEKEFKEIITGKQVVTIKTQDNVRINPTGYKEYDRTQTVSVECTCPNADGSDIDTWIYTATAPRIEQNGEKKYDKTAIKIEREIQIPVTEKDKIFFLLFLSKAGQKGRIYVVNEAKAEDEKIARMSRNSRVDFLLTDDLSPVNEITIRRVAKAFGVSGVDKKSKSSVILALKDVISIAETTNDTFRNSEAFVKAINLDESTNVRAMVQEAFDDGRIKFNEVESYFYYANLDGEEIKKIMNVDLLIASDKIKRTNAICNLYAVSPDRLKDLTNILNYTVDDVDFNDYEYVSLKKFASAHGISGSGKADELVPRIQKVYDAEKTTRHFDFSILAISEKKQPTE